MRPVEELADGVIEDERRLEGVQHLDGAAAARLALQVRQQLRTAMRELRPIPPVLKETIGLSSKTGFLAKRLVSR